MTGTRATLRRVLLLEHLRDVLAPPRCLACGAPGDDLCGDCRRALPFLSRPQCPRCALPAPCGRRCPATAQAFDHAWAPVAHQGPAKELVAALKFRTARRAASEMAAQMAANAPADLLHHQATLVPVPSRPTRTNRRGYDHATLIARSLAKRTGLSTSVHLARQGTAGQLGAGRTERLASTRLQIVCTRPSPAWVVLVDDVHTTGATLDACARALRVQGAEHVSAATYSRTLRRT